MRLWLGTDTLDMDVTILLGRVLSYGMDDTQQDQYEERLKEVFHSFDASGLGSLCPEELSELCLSLHLEDATPALLNALLQNQDRLTGRVDFEQFKNALILVLSASVEAPAEDQEPCPPPDSPEVHPKFVRGSKRYGRRSIPEFIEPVPDFSEIIGSYSAAHDPEDNVDDDDSTLPRKRERWNAHDSSTEEFEAEGQLHLWNPDEPGTPRGSIAPLSDRLEEKLRDACEELALPWDGSASHPELLALCEHLGLEITEDAHQFLSGDGVMSVAEFVSRVLDHCKPPTPSASTPYRQLKRLHSTQPFDLTGRRITDPSVMTSTIGMRLFSTLDDGTGFTPVEQILDAWMEEGIQNSIEILQALEFDLEGKVNLSELTSALENELLMTKNGIHQAALASFKSEIRHLMECVDRELREKEKIRSDLEKAEKLKTQLAAEVDEHHSAIERMNDLNLKKLEQDHKERLATLRAELIQEMDQMQQQAGLQREQLEAEVEKIREDETFLRDHLSITVKENRRLEMELLDTTEKLVEAENHVTKLQKNMDNILKEKFGDLDPASAEFFLQQERLEQLRSSYEQQCRELQDRIDELQSELHEYHGLGRAPQPGNKPVSEEFESKSPGMESDPGIGSEEGQPFNMSLEAEMMLEHLKEQHLREIEDLRAQLESKVSEFNQKVEEQRAAQEQQKMTISLQYQEDIHALKEEMASVQSHAEELQSQIEQAESDRTSLEQRQAGERSELEDQQEEEVSTLRQQLLEAHTNAADLEDQLKALEARQAETELNTDAEMEELKRRHALELNKMEAEPEEMFKARLEEEGAKQRQDQAELERRLAEEWETEKERLKQCHREDVKARLEEASVKFQAEHEELEMRLSEEWEKERAQLDAQGNESLQVVLEEEMLRLFKEQEEREGKLLQQWEVERAQLLESHEDVVLRRLAEESSRLQEQHEQRERKLMEEWAEERAQLEEDYEAMLQERLSEEREKVEAEKEELEKSLGQMMEEEKARLEEAHREAMQGLIAKHSAERDELSSLLDKLREDVADERRELESRFSQKISAVETRFLGDQEAVAERFHADVLKLEQHYQSELKALSESHAEQKVQWGAEMEMALRESEEQRRVLQETLKLEREFHDQELVKERDRLERAHKEEVELVTTKNQELRNELDRLISLAQTKEIELSRQLNDLHNRLQENMDTKDELLGQSDRKALEIELLLNQSVEDFKQERSELQNNLSTLENQYKEAVSLSEKHLEERMALSSECEDLKLKIQELELLLKQAAMDFELERQELQDNISSLEVSLNDNLACCEQQENDRVELIAQRDQLSLTVKELEIELNQLLKSSKTPKEIEESNDINSPEQDNQIAGELVHVESGEEATGDDYKNVTFESREKDCEHQDGQADERSACKLQQCRDSLVDSTAPEETADPDEEANAGHFSPNVHNQEVDQGEVDQEEVDQVPPQLECEQAVIDKGVLYQDEQTHSLAELQTLFVNGTDNNLILQCEITLLQQKIGTLESLLAAHRERFANGQQALEENYNLKTKMLLILQQANEMETVTSDMADLQARYEDCLCQNAKLEEKNGKLENRIWGLESRMRVLQCSQDQQMVLMNDIARMRGENSKLTDLIIELEKQDEILLALQQENEIESPLKPIPDNSFLELNSQLEAKVQAVSELEDCCTEFENENDKLRRALTELQDKSLRIHEKMRDHRCEANRLAEENLKLRQSISTLKEEDLQEAQDELISKLEHFREEKLSAQKMAEKLQRQISEMRARSQQLEEENGLLSEENAQNAAGVKDLSLQLTALLTQSESKELARDQEAAKERAEMAACVSAMKAELIGALEAAAQLQNDNSQLAQQLCVLREKVTKIDTVERQTQGLGSQLSKAHETIQTLDLESAHLRSDLRVSQQEREALKHEVLLLHKQLQKANDANQVVEISRRSSGFQSPQKKLYQTELARLVEQEQQILRQENERLQTEVQSTKGDLLHSREKIRQLESTVMSLKQQKHQNQSSLLKIYEKENASLKQELEAQKELLSVHSQGEGYIELDSLRQENDGLKIQVSRLHGQLIEALQAQLGGLLPPSPHRMPGERRGQHRGDEHNPDHLQDDKEMKMRTMEGRLREIELSLHNVKLLLKEKVAQLKDQLHRNGRADVLIKDLYVENSKLLKTLEMTEQRQKIAEKKNYLLQEKISSLNKIVRDLNPSTIPQVPYHFTCS
ncbi:ninein [Aplochiton taeniatus]